MNWRGQRLPPPNLPVRALTCGLLVALAMVAAPGAAVANGDRPPPLGPAPPATAPAMEQFAYGFDLLRAARPGDAVGFFVRGLRADPDNALAHFYLAESYRFTGKSAEAARHYRRTMSLAPESPQARQAGEMLKMLGEESHESPHRP